jgi:quercetin dioxygenase-like cupin family protein
VTTLALYEDLLGPGEMQRLPAGNRVLYVASGAASSLGPNEAWFGDGEVTVAAGHEGATVLRWELTEWEPDAAKLAAHVELDPWAEYVVRCDRVDFPPGGVAYRHVHPGPGIRCVLAGTIRIESPDGVSTTYGPFDAWFEGADYPVVASGSESSGTSFVRVLVLPKDWAGKRTIRYVDPADDDKPRLQRATTFLDEPISL